MTTTPINAKLAMTKIVVADVDAASAFYRAVCGFTQVQRIEDTGFCEIILQAPGASTAALVVMTYAGAPLPPPGECVLVFETHDIEGFVARTLAAGGTVTQPPTHIAALGLSYAMLRDPEGHVVEALQYGAPA